MHARSPVTAEFYELNGVPYARLIDAVGEARVFNCAVEPPAQMDDFQRLDLWQQIDEDVFLHLCAIHQAAAEVCAESPDGEERAWLPPGWVAQMVARRTGRQPGMAEHECWE